MQRFRYLIAVLALVALSGCSTTQPNPVNDLPLVEYESARVVSPKGMTSYHSSELVSQTLLFHTNFAFVDVKLTP